MQQMTHQTLVCLYGQNELAIKLYSILLQSCLWGSVRYTCSRTLPQSSYAHTAFPPSSGKPCISGHTHATSNPLNTPISHPNVLLKIL